MAQQGDNIDNKVSDGMITVEVEVLDGSDSLIASKTQMFRDEVAKYQQVRDSYTLEGRQSSNIIDVILHRLAKENSDLYDKCFGNTVFDLWGTGFENSYEKNC